MPVTLPRDLRDLPPFIDTPTFCALAGGLSRATILLRVRSGLYPRPEDRCGRGYLWRRDDVLRVLRLSDEEQPPRYDGGPGDPWMEALKG